MLRGYRLVVLALVGCLACGGIDQAHGNPSVQPATKSDQSQASAIAQATDAGLPISASKEAERCNTPNAKNGPDICAQWAAANAAREGAQAGWWTFYVNVAGLLALLLTLAATAWAAYAAARAAKVADATARHFVNAERARISVSPGKTFVDSSSFLINVIIEVENYGRSAAKVSEVRWESRADDSPPKELGSFVKVGNRTVPASETISVLAVKASRDFRKKPYISGLVRYTTSFGSEHISYFCFIIRECEDDRYGNGDFTAQGITPFGWPETT